MKLQRVLAAAAIIGFVVPLASYTEWWLLMQNIFGPPWRLRLTGIVDHFFIQDVLLISAINVPLYMALVMVWWSIAGMKRKIG